MAFTGAMGCAALPSSASRVIQNCIPDPRTKFSTALGVPAVAVTLFNWTGAPGTDPCTVKRCPASRNSTSTLTADSR